MARMGKFVLDPTGLYSPAGDAVSVASERQWLEHVGRTSNACWVSGEWLCRWTREWLRYHDATQLVVDEKRFPRPLLQAYLKNVPIPNEWDDRRVLAWVEKLESYPTEDCIAYFLADLTCSAPGIWFEPPSIEHLAYFLGLEIPSELQPFLSVWAEGLRGRIDEEWVKYYASDERQEVLRSWLGIQSGACPDEVFPLEVPGNLEAYFDAHWATKLTQTECAVLDSIDVAKQTGIRRIAAVAAGVFASKQSWLTTARFRKLVPFLPSQTAQQLRALIPPDPPMPLSLDASPAAATKWATSEYLPYRKWQTRYEPHGAAAEVAQDAAALFVDWLLNAYPTLKLDPVAHSSLNYSSTTEVMTRSAKSPVLWVVVDGLGWLEHVELLRILCGSGRFSVTNSLTPKIAILPTKTEFAKWSLYSQLLPSHLTWEPDAGKGFQNTADCERYTDAPSRRESLAADLKANKRRVYCWDTVRYDSLFHNDTNWRHLVEVAVPNLLATIADEILYFVSQHPEPASVQVVICSDHGQLMGEHEQLDSTPTECEYSGRMAYGSVEDPRFVRLDAEKYGTQRDISVVRGPGCIRPYQVSHSGEAVGVHGGLYPEEVIVGMSVLRLGAHRKPLTVVCSGMGKAQQAGILRVDIVNPNESNVTDGYLYVSEIPSLAGGIPLRLDVAPFGQTTVYADVDQWPESPFGGDSNRLKLTGVLRFRFSSVEDSESQLSAASALEITQMFRSGLDIDEFI